MLMKILFSLNFGNIVFFGGGRGEGVSQAAIVTAPLVPLPLTCMINCWTLLRTCWDRRIGIGRFKINVEIMFGIEQVWNILPRERY